MSATPVKIPADPSKLTSAVVDPLLRLRAWQRFHLRLTGLYGGTVLVSLALIATIFYYYSVSSEVTHLQRRLLSTVTGLAASVNAQRIAAVALDAQKRTAYHDELRARFAAAAQTDSDIQSIYLLRLTDQPGRLRFFVDYVKEGALATPGDEYDARALPVLLSGFNAPAVENEPFPDEFGLTLSGYAPVRDASGKGIALVGADVQASRIEVMKRDVMWVTLGVFGIAAVLLGLISLAVARSVRDPLTRIIDATAAVARGELATRLSLTRRDEFGVMSRHFDKMAEGLQDREFIRATFGRYVSEDVARELLEHRDSAARGAEEREVTILFSDLTSYSTICENLPPVQLLDMLNHYLSAMNELIDAHHGCVIEILGDAILAVFGAPYYRADHPQQALRCALAMRDRLVQLNGEWQASGLAQCWTQSGIAQLKARIGVHTGRVVAGSLGGETRMKYAVIGDAVNVASRLEALNKELGTDVLISAEVYRQLPVELARGMRECGMFRVKGRAQEVSVYAPC